MPATRWPAWWEWELEFSIHAEVRMEERGITEVEVRHVLQNATTLSRGAAGRWIATGRRGRQRWRIVLEPDDQRQRVVVVTAYRLG
jgi:hypothetical protein